MLRITAFSSPTPIRFALLGVALLTFTSLVGCEDEKKEEPPPKKGIEAMLTEGAPTIPEEFGDVPLWSREAVLLEKDNRFESDIEPEGYKSDIGLSHNEFQSFVQAYEVAFEHEDPVPLLTEKWGEPVTAELNGEAVHLWFNEKQGIRAQLDPGGRWRIRFEAFSPAAEFIGDDPAKFGFENDPLMGMTIQDASKKYADYLKEADETSIELLYPTTEYGVYALTLWADANENTGKIDRFRFSVEFEYKPDASGSVAEILTAKYGEPKEVQTVSRKELWFFHPDTGTRVKHSTSSVGGGISLEVDDYTPYDTLIGSDKGKMGFETTRLIGLSREDLKNEYADFVDDSSSMSSLQFPPSEFESYNTTVWPDFEGDAVTGYHFGIPFKGYPAARDAIFNKLKAVYGEPKQEQSITGDTIYLFSESPRIEVEEDDISKGWRIRVSRQ